MNRDKFQHGFTLIELLVVVSIIALLIALLLPALKKARQTAQAVQCAAQLRQFGIGFNTYANDFDDTLPGRRTWTFLSVKSGFAGADSVFFKNYMNRNQAVYHCPSGPTGDVKDPSLGSVFDGQLSYVENGRIDGQGYGAGMNKNKRRVWPNASLVGILVGSYRINETSYNPKGTGWSRWLADRHDGGENVVFLDGHVSHVSQAVWQLTAGEAITNGKGY